MSLQNVNGTITQCFFSNVSTSTANAIFTYPSAILLYSCQILFANLTLQYIQWNVIGSASLDKGFLLNSAINNVKLTLSNVSFLSTIITNIKGYFIIVINNFNNLYLFNCNFWNNSCASKS